MLRSAWHGNGIVTIGSEMLRKCLETKRLERQWHSIETMGEARQWHGEVRLRRAMEWQGKAGKSNGYGCKA
nr:MAG TPA: hypothetical protein [Caudoviricetes sp.]